MIENNLRFPGQYFDEETGYLYNWHRYYNPETGRYLTPDPIGLEGGMNVFVYADNDPVNFVDPEGLEGVGIQKPTTDGGKKRKHIHYGTESDPRRDGAVDRDGNTLHKNDKKPTKRQKKLIRKRYPNFFKPGVKSPFFIIFEFQMKFFNPWDKNNNNMTVSEAALLQLYDFNIEDDECDGF